MITTVEILDRLQSERNLNLRQIAAIFDVTSAAMTWYRTGQPLSDHAARAAAELLNENPAYFVVCVTAEKRRGTDMYPVWRMIAETVRKSSVPPKKQKPRRRRAESVN